MIHPALPRQLARVIARALDGETDDRIARHYGETMPRMREEQLRHPLFQAPLRWDRLPRMTAALTRLRDVLVDAGVDATIPIGAPTLAVLHEATHYGGAMPMLYGYPADLDYFLSHGMSPDETIDRYLTAPVLHEVCHLDRDRDALPPHLDECIAGWLGVHVWPEFAYPEPGHDDAIYAAPWLAQIGHAMVRTFGVREVVRAHAGYASTLPSFEDAYWEDWQQRRTLHFLSDTMNPEPWIALVTAGRTLAPDPVSDRRIVTDALRAMCLVSDNIGGSFRTRTELPRGPIVVDGSAHRVTTAPHNALDIVPPRYWLPPCVTESCEVTLTSLDEIPALVDRLIR